MAFDPRGPLPAAIAAAFVLVLAQGARAASAIDPGYWSFKLSSMLAISKSGLQCVKPDQIDDFLAGPHNRHYTCSYPVRTLEDGEAALSGECVSNKGLRYRIALKGRYSASAFALNGRITGPILGLKVSLPIAVEARRLAATCPTP